MQTSIVREWLRTLAAVFAVGFFAFSNATQAQNKIPATTASAVKPVAPDVNASPNLGKLEVPAIVAAVNGQTISRDELAKLCLQRAGDEVLDNMLNKMLILQACQAQQIMISQKDVDDEIERIASKFKLSSTMYLKLIRDQRDITAEQYMSDVVWPMLALRQLARDKVVISQDEIQKAFDAEFGPKVQVRMLAVDKEELARDLHQQAKSNPDSFKLFCKKHSLDPASASVEGLLPPIRRYASGDPIEEVAFKLQPNEISDVFPVGEMFLCLQCVRHLPASSTSPEQMVEIQENIRRSLEDEKLREVADSIFKTLREQSSIVKVLGNAELERQYPGVAAIINRQNLPLKTIEDACIDRHGSAVLDGAIHRKVLEGALIAAQMNVAQPDLDQEIARAAEYYGMLKPDGKPDVEGWLREVLSKDGATVELYVSDVVWPTVALKKLIADKVKVDETDFAKGFESNYGPRAEVLAIVCSNQRTAQEVWQMARDNPTEQFFGELASQYSTEPSSRSNFGKVPPLRRHGGQPTLEEAAFKLQPGELSPIVESGGQYIVLKSQGFTTPVVTDPEVVRSELTKDILEKKQRVAMEQHLETLMSSAQIDNFLKRTSQLGTSATQASLKVLKEEASAKLR